jgi:hypothetical protein
MFSFTRSKKDISVLKGDLEESINYYMDIMFPGANFEVVDKKDSIEVVILSISSEK